VCLGEPSHASMVTADKALCLLSINQHNVVLDVHGVEMHMKRAPCRIILRRTSLQLIQTMQI
jgi:hypothetical protein